MNPNQSDFNRTRVLVNDCIECSYSLVGHCATGVCPECGAPFDRVEKKFRFGARKEAIFGLCILPYIAWTLWNIFTDVTAWSINSVALILMSAVVLYSLWAMTYYRNLEVVISKLRLRVTHCKETVIDIPMSEIQSITYSRVNGSVVVHLSSGVVTTLPGKEFFGSHKKTQNFVQATNAIICQRDK